jgi:hypothetical protein
MGTATDDVKKEQFPNFLEPDSVADEWFEELDLTGKKDWSAIVASFHKRWPKKVAVKKTVEEYEQEITSLCLKMENIGKKETVAGREVYTHIAWADDMAVIVRGAKLEATATFIGHVRKELPKLLREKVGTGHTDWKDFLQAIRDIDLDYIRDGVNIWKKEEDIKRNEQNARKKELEDQEALKRRIQQLEKVTNSPTAPLRHQMTSFNIGNPPQSPGHLLQQSAATPLAANPFENNNGGRGNLFYPNQAKPYTQSNNPRPVATQADRAALLQCMQKYPHHPDSDAGRLAHQAQQADWIKTHGQNAFVTESTPYPLRPGTLPVGSSECFTCGFSGHMG